MIVTGIVTYGILTFEKQGFRPIELIIGALVSIICLCYLIENIHCPGGLGGRGIPYGRSPAPRCSGGHDLRGHYRRTVMPHAIYLHSGLTQVRLTVHNDADRRKLLHFSNREVVVALAIAEP